MYVVRGYLHVSCVRKILSGKVRYFFEIQIYLPIVSQTTNKAFTLV